MTCVNISKVTLPTPKQRFIHTHTIPTSSSHQENWGNTRENMEYSAPVTCFQSVQYLVMYVRQCVNMCSRVSVLRAAAFHIPLVSFFIRLFTSRAEYRAVGGSEWKVRAGELGVRGVGIESHFSKFDPISVILKPPVFKGPSTLLSSLWQAEKPERWGL